MIRLDPTLSVIIGLSMIVIIAHYIGVGGRIGLLMGLITLVIVGLY